MTMTRRQTTQLLLASAAAAALPRGVAAATQSPDVLRAHGASLMGELKYPAGFPHFRYVNPDAPKGGEVRIDALGGFDSFHPFIPKGDVARGIDPFYLYGDSIYEQLMMQPLDAPSEEYCLLAEWMEWPKDFSWAAFKLREGAHWHDGRPVTVEDAIFSFNILMEKGDPRFRLYYGNVEEATDAGGGVVRFRFDQANNRELPQIMGQLPILPKHYWEERDFSRSSLDKPLGSGPYRIGDFEVNRFCEFERVEDYWGAELPVNIGLFNFDRIRFEYYKDSGAGFDAFKAGRINYRRENSSRSWSTGYDFPAVKRGEVERESVTLEGSKAVAGFIFNQRREKFQDRRVREAIGLMFDFDWTNKTILYNQYERPTSFFQGHSDLMATGLPEGAELAILEEYRDRLPPEVFEKPFENPATDGSGRLDRRALRRAKALLKEAGWNARDGVLVNADGEPFEIEFMIGAKSSERIIAPYLRNLERLGITGRIRMVDSAQYVSRVQERDFDMMTGGWQNSASPGNEQREFWGSDAATSPGSRNVLGLTDPVVDELIERLIFWEDRADLVAATKALDRVLLWGHHAVMQFYRPHINIAYWKDKVVHPDPLPSHEIGFPKVWWSAEAGE